MKRMTFETPALLLVEGDHGLKIYDLILHFTWRFPVFEPQATKLLSDSDYKLPFGLGVHQVVAFVLLEVFLRTGSGYWCLDVECLLSAGVFS